MPTMTTSSARTPSWYSLDSLVFISLGLFAFSVVFSVTAVQASLFLIIIFLLISKHRQKALPGMLPALARHPLFIPWMVYLGVCLLTAVTAYYPAKGFSQLNSDFLKYVCLSALLLAVRKEHLPRLSLIYMVAAALSAAVGISEAVRSLLAGDELLLRANAFMNAVRYGEVMMIALALPLAKIICSEGQSARERWFYAITAALTFLAVILSRTRGAYLGFFVFLFFLLVLGKGLRLRVLLLTGALAGIGLLTAFFHPDISGRFSITAPKAAQGPVIEEAVNIRLELWQMGWEMFKSHPVLGIGPDNVKSLFTTYRPGLIFGTKWGSIHNLYLHQAAERGIVGLGALLFLFLSFFLFAVRNLKRNRNACTLWAACVLPAFYAMNITEISFQHVHTSFAVFMALAFSAVSSADTQN